MLSRQLRRFPSLLMKPIKFIKVPEWIVIDIWQLLYESSEPPLSILYVYDILRRHEQECLLFPKRKAYFLISPLPFPNLIS